mmetsp:Transcript_19129/g.39033  ORF Transcript_19129/g.39033 Transcript_19129/m.39033 type:complete len:236 (-) Transcript_19129:558-1265(-)
MVQLLLVQPPVVVLVEVLEDLGEVLQRHLVLGLDEVEGGGEDGDEDEDEREAQRRYVQPPHKRRLVALRRDPGGDEVDGGGGEEDGDGEDGAGAREGRGHEEGEEADEHDDEQRGDHAAHVRLRCTVQLELDGQRVERLSRQVVAAPAPHHPHRSEQPLLRAAVLREVDGRAVRQLLVLAIPLLEVDLPRANEARHHSQLPLGVAPAAKREVAELAVVREGEQHHRTPDFDFARH